VIFHHLGVATNSLKNAIDFYKKVGYQIESEFKDHTLMVDIVFLSGLEPRIELVQAFPENKMLENILGTEFIKPYHMAYEVHDFSTDILRLRKLGLVQVRPTQYALAFNNARICFLTNNQSQFIELIEIKTSL
jgi:catechol 2,3-dioxygenase-like lactoylglutathione lyase family enzyme